jgi:uncharacterized delta-60 repeat protein
VLREASSDLSLTDMFVGRYGAIHAFGSILTPSGQMPFMNRITSKGELDTSFGMKTWDPTGASDTLVAVGPDGRGWATATASEIGGAATLSVERLQHNGSLDPSFGGDGTFDYAEPSGFQEGDDIVAVIAQADGRIIVAGTQRTDQADVFVMRLTADGVADPEFDPDGNADGVSIIDLGDNEYAGVAVIDSHGGLLVGGWQGALNRNAFPMVLRILLR